MKFWCFCCYLYTTITFAICQLFYLKNYNFLILLFTVAHLIEIPSVMLACKGKVSIMAAAAKQKPPHSHRQKLRSSGIRPWRMACGLPVWRFTVNSKEKHLRKNIPGNLN